MSATEEYLVRSASLADCQIIADMINKSAEGAVDYLFGNMQQATRGVSVLASQLSTEVHYSYANTLVVERNSDVVAAALSFPSSGLVLNDDFFQHFDADKKQYFEYFSSNSITDAWHLDALFVDKDHRKLGLGTKLLDKIKQQARQYDFPVLQVFAFASNKLALEFYQTNGFLRDKKINVSSHNFLQDKQGLVRLLCNL